MVYGGYGGIRSPPGLQEVRRRRIPTPPSPANSSKAEAGRGTGCRSTVAKRRLSKSTTSAGALVVAGRVASTAKDTEE